MRYSIIIPTDTQTCANGEYPVAGREWDGKFIAVSVHCQIELRLHTVKMLTLVGGGCSSSPLASAALGTVFTGAFLFLGEGLLVALTPLSQDGRLLALPVEPMDVSLPERPFLSGMGASSVAGVSMLAGTVWVGSADSNRGVSINTEGSGFISASGVIAVLYLALWGSLESRSVGLNDPVSMGSSLVMEGAMEELVEVAVASIAVLT